MKKGILYIFMLLTFYSCEQEREGIQPNTDQSAGVSSNEGQGGSLATFALKGDYLYVVDERSLNVFNIAENDNPVKVNRVPIGFRIETLFSYKDYLYIGSQNGMFIYDISSPEWPVELSSVSHFTACDPVIANDSMAYVTLHSNTNCGNNINVLEIYDVTTLTNPQLVSRRNLASPKGLGLYENFLVVCDDEIKIFDVSNPAQYTLAESIQQYAFDVIIRNDLLIAIGYQGLYQYRLTKNGSDIEVKTLSTIDI